MLWPLRRSNSNDRGAPSLTPTEKLKGFYELAKVCWTAFLCWIGTPTDIPFAVLQQLCTGACHGVHVLHACV
jgi:hypothetical protein